MGIPGVGFQELVIILIAALLIFGPNKLPEVMGQAGRAIRDFRKMTGNLQDEFEKNINEAAGTDVRKTLSSEISNLKGEVQSATNAVNGKAAPKTTVPRPATTAAKATTSAAKPGTTSTTAAKTATSTSTAAKKTGASVVGVGSAKTAAAAAAPADSGSGEIEFAPVLTSTRRRSGSTASAATLPASKPAAAATAVAEPAASASESDPSDPFARVRSRRQSAGYQR
ncbi:MAG TPA: twin-arginine translocase TatA/TatE family subunit [Thermomicrobiales bacterium]|jgi:Tat protein translocase TatB subunit|nr:twin-arginine translocase TatA/TatE family subunit [Thermomicrobiales bacterium]